MRRMKSRGFSLLELMVALSIAALLLGLSVPAFIHQRAAAALRSASDQTLSALHLARRLALARGQTVTVCPSADGVSCAFGGARWLLFANDENGTSSRFEPPDQLVRSWQLPHDVVVRGTRGYAAFQPRPGSATTVTFEFTHRRVTGISRSVVVSQTGRPRLALPF